jgi:hypothetical protein
MLDKSFEDKDNVVCNSEKLDVRVKKSVRFCDEDEVIGIKYIHRTKLTSKQKMRIRGDG